MTRSVEVAVPSPMTGLSHVQLLVADIAASEQWYAIVLGLERFAADEDKGYVALRHSPTGVLVVLSARAPGHGAGDTTLDHIAFAVPDGATLRRWAEHLTDVGVEHAGIVSELGKPSLQLRDPDGTAVELVAPAEA